MEYRPVLLPVSNTSQRPIVDQETQNNLHIYSNVDRIRILTLFYSLKLDLFFRKVQYDTTIPGCMANKVLLCGFAFVPDDLSCQDAFDALARLCTCTNSNNEQAVDESLMITVSELKKNLFDRSELDRLPNWFIIVLDSL